ncbi:MAG: DUF397 domain-containing protein [Actinomycetota bacterium]|nr:DUF397 domain-containing protein [Actinomycetota bacterium]
MEGAGMNWHKSSYSGNGGGNCTEVATTANLVLVRDSKNPEGAKLAITTASWRAFTAKVKASLADPLPIL